jgi:hypothetical protein
MRTVPPPGGVFHGKDDLMKKAVCALLVAAIWPTAALAGHNPTPAEGYRNYGQCRSDLAQAQNDVRKNPDEYSDMQAEDIETATCEKQANGSYRIMFN